jgi:hypothetical protein
MDFHATETTCMPSIRFHFLTFLQEHSSYFLQQKMYHIPSGCLFYTVYDKLVQWLHASGGVWQWISRKRSCHCGQHTALQSKHIPVQARHSPLQRDQALSINNIPGIQAFF